MNKLDRAFIKAYGKQQTQRPVAAARHKPAAAGAPHAAPAEPTHPYDFLSAAAISTLSFFNPPQSAPPAPHIATGTLRSEPKAAAPPAEPWSATVVYVHSVTRPTAIVAAAPSPTPAATASVPPTVEPPPAASKPAPQFRLDAAVPKVAAPHITTFTSSAAAPLSVVRSAAPPVVEAPPRIIDPVQPAAPSKPVESAPARIVPAVEPPARPVTAPVVSTLPAAASLAQTASAPPARLRPLFEVDRLPWPQICQSLSRAASDELAQAADDLLARSARGEKLILVTSRRRGEGRTTMALCLAKLLAARDASVALVDADFSTGQLVRQLKLLPQAGWEQVLRGDIPLEEALVESMEDHLVVLPLQGPLQDQQLLARPATLGDNLQRLRDEYDIVLVDAGPHDDRAAGLSKLIGSTRFQAAIVVQDTRTSQPAELEELLQQLRSVPRVEIAENFVAAA